MKIAVIGHLCRDIVHVPDGNGSERVTESYGGIFWAIATLAGLLAPEDVVYPIFGVGDDERDNLFLKLDRFRNVDSSGVFSFKGPINQVHLFHDANGRHRTECSKHIAEPIGFSRIKPFLNVDGVLVNMVSGSDMTIETMDQIRMLTREKSIPIHFDFHSLTLGIDREFKRFRRPVDDWRRWAFMADSIQLSEEEAAGLSSEKLDEMSFARHALSLMVNGLIITRDKRGGTLFRQEQKKIHLHHFGGIPVKIVDPTGCGDVFGAAFFCERLKTKDWIHSVEFANQVAASKATFSGVDGVDRILETLEVRTPL